MSLLRAIIFVLLTTMLEVQSPASELWSFQPISPGAVPEVQSVGWGRTPIDSFVLAKLEEKGLRPNPEADRQILIRRLSFDLLGLPPTPEEIRSFMADERPNAVELLVDRLLASPRYGEHWARHWLDVMRYTESQGFEYDHLRPNAWHYRDYVIRSFNADKPYNQFVEEQIAGDVIRPGSADGIVATSVLVCGPWDQAGSSQANLTQRAITREEELEDLISAVSQGILGITVNCARCHSHKFDPVPQSDYYRMKAVFQGVRHGERPVISDAALAERESRIAAVKKRWAGNQAAIEAEVARLGPVPVSYAGTREQPAPTHLLKRGDVNSPGEAMNPGGLSELPGLAGDLGLTPDAPEAERRRRFAAWMVDPRNPLTPRVMVNRVWAYHFGRGLVPTPSDFGNGGGKPSHPELLDWLAARFIQTGWSLKELHRLILRSAVYRQGGQFRPECAEVDAGNQWLWRFAPRRLEAEAIRDSMLAVSGALNPKMGGPSFRPFDVITFNSSTYIPRDSDEPEFNRHGLSDECEFRKGSVVGCFGLPGPVGQNAATNGDNDAPAGPFTDE